MDGYENSSYENGSAMKNGGAKDEAVDIPEKWENEGRGEKEDKESKDGKEEKKKEEKPKTVSVARLVI